MYLCACGWPVRIDNSISFGCLVGHIRCCFLIAISRWFPSPHCTVKHDLMVDQVSFEDTSINQRRKTWFGLIWLVRRLKSSYFVEPAKKTPYITINTCSFCLNSFFVDLPQISKYLLADWHTFFLKHCFVSHRFWYKVLMFKLVFVC